MKKDEEKETTNLVQTVLKMVTHSPRNQRSKNAPKEVKIQRLEENSKKQM
jgi:hypothetical protein